MISSKFLILSIFLTAVFCQNTTLTTGQTVLQSTTGIVPSNSTASATTGAAVTNSTGSSTTGASTNGTVGTTGASSGNVTVGTTGASSGNVTVGTTGAVVAAATTGSMGTNFIRIINAVENQTLTVVTTEVGSIVLTYMQVSNYITLPGSVNTVTVTAVRNPGGIVFNTATIQLSVVGYVTAILTYDNNGTFIISRTEDTLSSNVTMNGQAYVRFFSLGGQAGFISVATGTTVLYTYIGRLSASGYAAVPAGTTSISIYQAGGTIANTYPLNFNGLTFQANGIYTIFFFTPASPPSTMAILYFDRSLSSTPSTTGSATASATGSATGSVTASATGSATASATGSATASATGSATASATGSATGSAGTTARASTSGSAATGRATTGRTSSVSSTGTSSGGSDSEDSSAAKVTVGVVALLAALSL